MIFELGCNHQGDLDLARRMVDDAKALGAWAVKIQKRSMDAIPEEQRSIPRDLANSFGDTYYAHRKALELSDESILRLKEHAEQQGLVFMTSVFDVESLRCAVEELNIKHVKLPSQLFGLMDVRAYLALKKAEYGLFVLRSTGMHTTREVLNDITSSLFDMTMYCRSIYPCKFEDVDFGSARLVFECLSPSERGYSSHDARGEAVPLMVMLGAQVVERHYTLDKTMKGSDHHTVSSDYADMQKLIESIREMEEIVAVKNYEELASVDERANRVFYMREQK